MRSRLTLLLFFPMALTARADTTLSLDTYLEKVRGAHEGYRGSMKASEGALRQSVESGLPYALTVFASAVRSSDARPTVNPPFQGSKTLYDSLSLGVGKTLSFGLQAKVSYTLSYTELVGVSPAFVPQFRFFDGRPQLELSQPLWRNGLGGELRAQAEAVEASLQAAAYGEAFKAKLVLLEAELAYWRLALARQSVEVQQQTLERARKISAWASRRVQTDLADRADLYQADAAVRLRELELQGAVDEQRSAALGFNAQLGTASDDVNDALQPFDGETLAKLVPPARLPQREDVLAAKEQARASTANADLLRERHRPSLDAYGTVALNGRDPAAGLTVGESFGTNHLHYVVGLRLTAPLDGTIADAGRAAAELQKEAAEMTFRRRLFDQEREWGDLERKLAEARRRLELSAEMEAAQERKLTYEKQRHGRGRSTTYQVLLFEQDYASAQLARIRAQADVLRLIAQMKTFGGAA